MSRINNLVKSWHQSEIIDTQTYKALNCINDNLPRCYGLPQVHKVGFPLRIIVSTLGSSLYHLAGYIYDILKNSIRKPKSRIKNS